MIEAEKVFMMRALDLARLGAGLVSPNPMVGAVLVKNGRVVGEGYHLYSELRHAESYAIEEAGKESREATLYCSLEPCCHHGRTPPCTDAVIRAGIARAVIATKDPDPRMNGRGIEQLRKAGIDVEVGLCEEEALRLNESYLKFVTERRPFVHGVVEYLRDDHWRGEHPWQPSADFIGLVSHFDAAVLGGESPADLAVLGAQIERERHRPAIVVAQKTTLDYLDAVRSRLDVETTAIVFDEPAPHQSKATHPSTLRVVDAGEKKGSVVKVGHDLEEVSALLGMMSVASAVVLPGAFDLSAAENFEMLDKLTLVLPPTASRSVSSRFALDDLEFDLDEASAIRSADFIELTGYPKLLEIA